LNMKEKQLKLPGPDHPISIQRNPARLVVSVAGRVVADTRNALTLREAAYPPVQYIPREDIDFSQLERTDHATYCPYKGNCNYYSVPAGGKKAVNAVWSYEDSFPAVAQIRGYVAFYPDRVDEIAERLPTTRESLKSNRSNKRSRMLVPATRLGEVEDLAMQAVESIVVGDPRDARTTMGPVASRIQYERVRSYIVRGIEEGATLLCGGPGRPAGLTRGYFVRPTVFSRVNNAMTIAHEEIFGPVLAIIPYGSDQEAIDTANDTDYGLSSGVWSSDPARAKRVAQRIRAGMVYLNGAGVDLNAPFGGYKKSGKGREWGAYGLRDLLEIKAIMCSNA
jgi:uncharacterized protein (DUF427 family)